jgi:hypothetical protein
LVSHIGLIALPSYSGSVAAAVPVAELPKTCAGCDQYISAETVASELGWAIGICNPRGHTLPKNTQRREANDCTVPRGLRKPTQSPLSTNNLELLPVLNELQTGKLSGAFGIMRKNWVDPRSHGSDLLVADEESAIGIRGWRKLTHPTLRAAKPPIMIPVFDSDNKEIFTVEERLLVVQGGDEMYHPEDYIDYDDLLWSVATSIRTDRVPLLLGESGLGKTEFFAWLANLMQLPFHRISIKATTEIADLEGKTGLKANEDGGVETVWEPGRITKFWNRPCVMLVDEPNAAADPAVWHFLRPLVDGAKRLFLDVNEGEFIDRHPWCILGFAMNPATDVKYTGILELNEADWNRVNTIWVDYPPEKEEKEIIIRKCLA